MAWPTTAVINYDSSNNGAMGGLAINVAWGTNAISLPKRWVKTASGLQPLP